MYIVKILVLFVKVIYGKMVVILQCQTDDNKSK